MKQPMVWIAALPMAMIPAPVAAVAPTYEQLMSQCGPQLQAVIPFTISKLEARITEWQQAELEDPALRDRGEPIIREDRESIAGLRANGIEDASMRAMIDEYRQAGSTIGKAKVRQALAEARAHTDPEAAAVACIFEAVLADLDGKPGKAN